MAKVEIGEALNYKKEVGKHPTSSKVINIQRNDEKKKKQFVILFLMILMLVAMTILQTLRLFLGLQLPVKRRHQVNESYN